MSMRFASPYPAGLFAIMAKAPKRSNLKGPGTCIFCGRIAGNKDGNITISMSRQHLWPEWIQKPFPKTHENHTNIQLKTQLLPDKTIAMQPSLKVHLGDVKTRRLRIVCEYHCNNGWISKAEDETKEFLIPLIRGEFFTLTEEHQKKFALWLAVACTVWEYTDNPTRSISDDDRRFIHDTREAPPHWSMWITNYRGSEWRTRYRHLGGHALPLDSLSKDYLVGPQPCNHQTTSLQIGELYMHVASSSLKSISEFDLANDLPGMMRLWPLRGPIQWPNLFTLDDAAAMAIADRMMTSNVEILKTVDW